MARPALNDDSEEKPLDPAVERIRRRLIRFMLVNFGLLFIALMAVAAAIVYKAGHKSAPAGSDAGVEAPAPAEAPTASAEIALPAGSTLVSQSVSGALLSLDVRLADGSRAIFVYDTGQKRMIGRYAVVAR
jgi:hypothetical protein